MIVKITLTTVGLDQCATFDLYSNTDGFTTPFETGVAKTSLFAGYTSMVVPDGTTTIRIKAHNCALCPNYIDLLIITTTTTTSTTSSTSTTTSTTSTSTTANPAFTTTTTTTTLINYNNIGVYSVYPTLVCVPTGHNQTIYLTNADYATFVSNGGLLAVGMLLYTNPGTPLVTGSGTRIYDSAALVIYSVNTAGVIIGVAPGGNC